MYQRYYKQRKFGKLFSLFLVIGSGIAHYVRSFLKSGRKIFDTKTLTKYDSYLPEKFNNSIESFCKSDDKFSKILNFQNQRNEEFINNKKFENYYDRNTNIYQFYSRPFLNEEKIKLKTRHKAYRIYMDFKEKMI